MAFGAEIHAPWNNSEIILRGLGVDDLACLPLMGDEASRYLPAACITEWEQLQNPDSPAYRSLRDRGDNLNWGICVPENNSSSPIGLIGYSGIGTGELPQLRVVIARDEYLHRGIGSAVFPFVSWYAAFEEGITGAQALVERGNEASIHILVRSGFYETDKRTIDGHHYHALRQSLDPEQLDSSETALPRQARVRTLQALNIATHHLVENSHRWPSRNAFSNLNEAKRSLDACYN